MTDWLSLRAEDFSPNLFALKRHFLAILHLFIISKCILSKKFFDLFWNWSRSMNLSSMILEKRPILSTRFYVNRDRWVRDLDVIQTALGAEFWLVHFKSSHFLIPLFLFIENSFFPDPITKSSQLKASSTPIPLLNPHQWTQLWTGSFWWAGIIDQSLKNSKIKCGSSQISP